jgi:hypothetical protein
MLIRILELSSAGNIPSGELELTIGLTIFETSKHCSIIF